MERQPRTLDSLALSFPPSGWGTKVAALSPSKVHRMALRRKKENKDSRSKDRYLSHWISRGLGRPTKEGRV